jgi:hypothetical protein
MISSAWTRKLRRQDLPTRRRAANALLNIGSAIDTIELAELESIANAMRGNEREIERGIEKLRAAIDAMRSVGGVLNAAEKLLALGARITPLLI